MKTIKYLFFPLLITALISSVTTNMHAQTVDLVKGRSAIEANDRQFSKDFANGDSAALAAHYAKDGTWGNMKGNEILSGWGRMVKKSIKDNERILQFTTTSVSNDAEYLIEVGIYELLGENHKVRSKGRYLVVWKQENGEWKIYRDIGL